MIPILAVVGRSNSGKTSLIEKLIPELTKRGYRVATVKHSREGFDIDTKGKDSWRHQAAGASLTALSAPNAFVIMEKRQEEIPLVEICKRYIDDVDIIITEGYKQNSHPKVEMYRADCNEALLYENSEDLLAVAGDKPSACRTTFFGLNDVAALADLVEKKLLQNQKI